jgi:hypothetical protein
MDALYKATPALSLDPTQFNRAARRGRSPFVSAEELRQRNRAQDERLMGAGVVRPRARLRVHWAGRMARGCGVGAAGSSAGASLREPARALTRPGAPQAVNRSPLALERRFRRYEDATVDGIDDRLVPAGAKAPRWRESGHVASEEPVSSPKKISPATAAAAAAAACACKPCASRCDPPRAEGGRTLRAAVRAQTHFLLRDGGGASVQQWRSDGGGLERKGPAATVAAGDLTAAGVNVDSWPA